MTSNTEQEAMDVERLCKTEPEKKLSKAAKRNLKRKSARDAKKALKMEKQNKVDIGPRLPSSITLPESVSDKKFVSEELLAEIKKRISEKNSQTVRISPVPKNCPTLLLQDLCPNSISARIPSKKNSRYAFVHFKTPLEAKAAAEEVDGKLLDGKPIKAIVCSERPAGSDKWKPLEERTLEDFDLSSLYVCNLPRFAERTDLAQIFRTAIKINFMGMPDGTCKGFCILKYRTKDEALKAFSTRHGTLYKGIPIFVNFEIKSKQKSRVIEVDESKSMAVESISMSADRNTRYELPEKFTRKRKASECDLNCGGEPASANITLPNKKRRLEIVETKVVQPTIKEDVEAKQGTKRYRSATEKGKKVKKMGGEFAIQKSPKKQEKIVKLQPYQLARKKEISKVKHKPLKK